MFHWIKVRGVLQQVEIVLMTLRQTKKMQQQIEEALESSDLTNLKASVTHVFQFKAEVKPTSTCTSKMILFKRKKLSSMSISYCRLSTVCLTEIYYWLLFMEVQMKRIASCFIYGDSGKKVIMHYFCLLTCCLTLMVLTTLTLVGFFLSTASPVGGGRLVDQRSDGDHTKSESEQRLVF